MADTHQESRCVHCEIGVPLVHVEHVTAPVHRYANCNAPCARQTYPWSEGHAPPTTVRKDALADARVAILKAWDADRGDGERRPDYSKATWQKAVDAVDRLIAKETK